MFCLNSICLKDSLMDLFPGDSYVSLLMTPVNTPWNTAPHYTTAPMSTFQPGGTSSTGLTPTGAPRKHSPTQMIELNMMKALSSSQIDHVQVSDTGLPQLVEPAGGMKLLVSEPVTQVVNQGAATHETSPSSGMSAQENPDAVLPGIETLLTAIQVVERDAPAANDQPATFNKFTPLNSPASQCAEARLVLVFGQSCRSSSVGKFA